MQESRAGSTLELVVNEQQLQNMSQIDLSRQASAGQFEDTAGGRPEAPGGFLGWRALGRLPGQWRESLAARLDEAKAKSGSRAELAVELARAFSGLLVWLLCFVCTIILPVVLLLVGLLNLDACAASPSLPYFIFAIGFLMTASNLFNLALALDLPVLANHRLLASDIKSIISSILNIIFNTLVAFVYILTAFRVFTLAPDEPAAGGGAGTGGEAEASAAPVSGCNQTLFGLAFWFVALTLGLLVAVSLAGALLFAYNRHRLAVIRGSAPRSHARRTDLPGGQAAGAPPPSPHATTATNRL